MTRASRLSPLMNSRRFRSRTGSRTAARSSISATRRSISSIRRTSQISRASGASSLGRRQRGSTPARLSRSFTTAIAYISTGASDVFALDVQTGKTIWKYEGKLFDEITTVCCGWTSRGVAIGEDRVYLGKLDGKLVALDASSGEEVWSAEVGHWKNGETITSAPLYYDGLVVTGISGGEFGVRGRVTAYDADTGKEVWRFYTIPAPARQVTRRGRRTTTPGSTEALPSGRRRRSIPSSACSTSRRATRRRTSTAAAARVTTCSRTRSSRSTSRQASTSGTSSRCTTTSGISTHLPRSCSST